MNEYRIWNKKNNEWWQGSAKSVKKAIKQSNFPPENCEVKIRTFNGAGGWGKCKEI